MGLDCVGYIAHPVARFRLLNAQHQAFVGDLHQLGCLHRGLADQEHAAGIAVPAIDNHRHIDINDIAFFQLLSPGIPWQTTWLIEVQQLCVKPR